MVIPARFTLLRAAAIYMIYLKKLRAILSAAGAFRRASAVMLKSFQPIAPY